MFAALLSTLTGVLLALAAPGRDCAPLAWVALVPLLAATVGTRPAMAFRCGWIAGTTTFLLSVYWVPLTIAHYTWLPLVVATVPYLLAASYLGIYAGVAAVLWTAAARRGWPLLLAAPAAWVASEWLRSTFPIGFPWLLLGYAAHDSLRLAQVADCTGVYGLSALFALVSAALFSAAQPRVSARIRLMRGGLGVAAVCGVIGYGHWRLTTLEALPPAHHLQVALVQGNIEQDHKWDPAYQDETLRRYERLSSEAAATHPDLIVWPETAAPFFFQLASPEGDRVIRVPLRTHSPLLFGSPAFDYDEDGTSFMRNRAYLLDASSLVAGTYDKQVLVPFGEYVPLGRFLPFIHKAVEGAAPFRPGGRQAPIAVGNERYGVLICYEAIFPHLARQAVRDGATALVNITNDAWFGHTDAPAQHLAMAAMRAIETRRPLLRAANTGYSAVIDPAGRVLERTELFTTTSRSATLEWADLNTPYTQWGDWFALLCLGIAALACVGPRQREISAVEAPHTWNLDN